MLDDFTMTLLAKILLVSFFSSLKIFSLALLPYSYNLIRIPQFICALALALCQALAVVGNLALLEDKIDFIVAEGGIPVLLSLVNGVSAQAVWDAQVRLGQMLRHAFNQSQPPIYQRYFRLF